MMAVCSPQKLTRGSPSRMRLPNLRICPVFQYTQSPAPNGSRLQDCTAIGVRMPRITKVTVTADATRLALMPQVEADLRAALHAELAATPEFYDFKVLRSERYFGAVSRSFQLPMDIDQALAKAKYDNGVLTLTLPRKLTNGSQRLLPDTRLAATGYSQRAATLEDGAVKAASFAAGAVAWVEDGFGEDQ